MEHLFRNFGIVSLQCEHYHYFIVIPYEILCVHLFLNYGKKLFSWFSGLRVWSPGECNHTAGLHHLPPLQSQQAGRQNGENLIEIDINFRGFCAVLLHNGWSWNGCVTKQCLHWAVHYVTTKMCHKTAFFKNIYMKYQISGYFIGT
jgi:hypothetical protein